jgi:hypothetical protein
LLYPRPIGLRLNTFYPAHLSFPPVQRPHPPALTKIGTGILRWLAEKGSAGVLAAAVDGFGRRNKNLISNHLTLVEKFNISQQPYYLIKSGQ